MEQANAQIAELETYAQNADNEVSYEPLTQEEKATLTANEVLIESAEETAPEEISYLNFYPELVSEEALQLDAAAVRMMDEMASAIKADFSEGEISIYLDIIGVKVLKGQLAYLITNDTNPANLPVSSEMAAIVKNQLGYSELHFMYPQEFVTDSSFFITEDDMISIN